MVETVICVSAATQSCARSEVRLQDVTTPADVQHQQSVLFEEMTQRAISAAIAAPADSGPVADQGRNLWGDAGTEVADRKNEIVAQPSSSEAHGGTGDHTNTPEPFDHVAARIRTLYVELAEYQVAWKIGHKVQQDISQILRGQ